MNSVLCQRDLKRSRFSLPNDIWKWELKPQGFAILSYLCYLHIRCKKDVLPSVDEIASQLHMSKDMAAEWIAELGRCGLLDQHMVPILKSSSKNFFSLPNELFFLNIGHGTITVYVYLLCCEDRRTHQCHPSCRTIAAAVHLSAATVMKHIAKLEDQQLIAVENTNYIDDHGMKWNGNNLYTTCQSKWRWIIATSSRCSDWKNRCSCINRPGTPRVHRCEALCALLQGRADLAPPRAFKADLGRF